MGLLWLLCFAGDAARGQAASANTGTEASAGLRISGPAGSVRGQTSSRRFLRGRTAQGASAAQSLANARAQHRSMLEAQALEPKGVTLSATWQAVGPSQVVSLAYGTISGRVSSVAIDPADRTGNTVYVGTTGGGVWKSTNAAGPPANVTFSALTDDLPVFSGNAGSSATASLSIGAIGAQVGGVVLAGTGDPNDSTDSYYGSGVLRSADGGLTWTLAQYSVDGATGQHSFIGLGFAGFAWSTTNPSMVVAAVSQSAEGTIVNAPTKYSVMGLYVSSDAGLTWQMGTISDGTQVIQGPATVTPNFRGIAATSVVWNPVRQRFYAALRYHGYYESADGVSWSRIAHQPGAGMSLTACPSTPGTIGSLSCPVFRGTLAVQPTTGDMFALTTDRSNLDQGLWQDVCGAGQGGCASSTVSFGSQIGSSALEVGSGSTAIAQADYNLSLAAEASGPDTLLFVGTSDLYRCSLAAGCVLRNTTNATNGCAAPAQVAPAQHAIAVSATASVLFLGNDGGLWRSTDGVNQVGLPCAADDATHFQNLNAGLGSLAELVSFAQDPGNAANVLAGLGASGTVSSAGSAAGAWPQVSAGEGGTVAIDPTNPLLWYISTGAGVSLHGCASGARCAAADFAGPPTIGAVQTDADASVLDAPWILDPQLSANVLIGTCRVWRGPVGSGSLWSTSNELSATLGGPQNSACDPTTNPFVRSLTAGGPAITAGSTQNSGSQVLYAGMAGAIDGGGAFPGHIFTTAGADTASSTTRWVDRAGVNVTNDFSNSGMFNPGGFDISSITADAHDATGKTVYATVMGFSGNGISSPHLYGSTDGGAHWLNLSSNLPNAPADSVVVDPNDANTVYVALDTGVYVTTQVTSCSTANCWSVYGLALPNAPVVQLLAGSRIPTADGRIGMLRAATYGRGIWQIPLLTASTPAAPVMTLSPASLTFAGQAVGTMSSAQPITVTNTGTAPLLISRIAATGDFTTTDSCVGSTVGVNGSCTLQVKFVPSAQGSRTGVVTVYGNVSGGQATAALSGSATAPGNLVLLPLALSFASTMVNATSAAQNVTISNTGGTAVALPAPSITGDFQISANTCGTSLAPSTGCTVSVVFAPTADGVRNGVLTVSGGSTGALTATLTGTATTPATDALAPLALTFGTQELGTVSSAQQVTLTNAGDVPLTLIAATITSGDFLAVNGCGNSLNAHATCSIQVSYSPKSVGAESGVMRVSDQFRTQTVTLNGTGVAPPGVSLSPSGTMSFPSTAIGVPSTTQAVTLTNNGGLPLTIENVAVSGDFALGSSGTCGATLAPASTCVYDVVFTPTAGGTRNGGLVITDNAPTSPQTLALTGTGMDFTLAADGSNSASVASGKSAVYPLLLSSPATVSGNATLTCTGAPANATCVVSPSSAALGSTTLVTVTVQTGVSTASARGGGALPAGGARELQPEMFLAGALPIGLLALRGRRAARMMAVLAFVCVIAGSGCGVAREIPVSGGGGTISPTGVVTPSGNYTITVTASSSGLTRTTELALTVQ